MSKRSSGSDVPCPTSYTLNDGRTAVFVPPDTIDFVEKIAKSHVKAHIRKTASGKLIEVKEYDNSRRRKEHEKPSGRGHLRFKGSDKAEKIIRDDIKRAGHIEGWDTVDRLADTIMGYAADDANVVRLKVAMFLNQGLDIDYVKRYCWSKCDGGEAAHDVVENKGYRENCLRNAVMFEEYLNIMPPWSGGDLYRCMTGRRKLFDKIPVGGTFQENSMSSFTDKKSGALTFYHDVMLVIRGTVPVGGSIKFAVENNWEEVVIPSNAVFKVTKKTIIPSEHEDADPGDETLIVECEISEVKPMRFNLIESGLKKSHVKGHIRHEKSGKLTQVKEYDDKRQKKPEELKSSGVNLINAGVWGNRWRNLGGKIHVYEYQTKPNIELSVFDTSGIKGVQPSAILKELTDYAEKKGKKIELVGMPMILLSKYVGAFHAAGFKPASGVDAKKGVVMIFGSPVKQEPSKPSQKTKWVIKDSGKPQPTYQKFSGKPMFPGEGKLPQGSKDYFSAPAKPKPPAPEVKPGQYAQYDYKNEKWGVYEKEKAFGGIVMNDKGEILLRKPTNGFGGYAWTFPKGRQDKGDTPEQTALREVEEETGVRAKILGELPGKFEGDVTSTGFFIMQLESSGHEMDDETEAVEWVHPSKAHEYIQQTPNKKGQARDLSILEAAIKEIEAKGYGKKSKKSKWKSKTMQRWFGKSGDAFSRSSPMHILKGLALTEPDDRPDDDYDPDALKAGVEVEKEHTGNKSVAKKIAKDHLDEDPEYYKKLRKVDKH